MLEVPPLYEELLAIYNFKEKSQFFKGVVLFYFSALNGSWYVHHASVEGWPSMRGKYNWVSYKKNKQTNKLRIGHKVVENGNGSRII